MRWLCLAGTVGRERSSCTEPRNGSPYPGKEPTMSQNVPLQAKNFAESSAMFLKDLLMLIHENAWHRLRRERTRSD
jgi:hypothetical protein